jgi:hypothetical protein
VIVAHSIYVLIVTLLVGGVAASWVVVDIIRLRRALRENRRDPLVRDRIFGSIIGIVVGLFGVVGTVRYQLHGAAPPPQAISAKQPSPTK